MQRPPCMMTSAAGYELQHPSTPQPLLLLLALSQKRAWANVALLAFVGTFFNAVLITIVGR